MVLPVVDVHGRSLQARHLVPGPVPLTISTRSGGKLNRALTRARAPDRGPPQETMATTGADGCAELPAPRTGLHQSRRSCLRRWQPIPAPVRAGGDAHNRPGKVSVRGWPVESGIPERKDAAIRTSEPVTAAVGRRRNANYWLGEVVLGSRAVKMGVTIRRRPSRSCQQASNPCRQGLAAMPTTGSLA